MTASVSEFESPKRGGAVLLNPEFYPREERGRFGGAQRGGRGRRRGGQWGQDEYSKEQYGEDQEGGGGERGYNTEDLHNSGTQRYDEGGDQHYGGGEGRYDQGKHGFNTGGRGGRGGSGEQSYNRGNEGYEGDRFNRGDHLSGGGEWQYDQSEHGSKQQYDQKSYKQGSYEGQEDSGGYGEKGIKEHPKDEFGTGGSSRGIGRDGYTSSYSKDSNQYYREAGSGEDWPQNSHDYTTAQQNNRTDNQFGSRQPQGGSSGVEHSKGFKSPAGGNQYTADSAKKLPGMGGDEQATPKHDGPTISSLQQKGGTPTVIPGLGAVDEPEEDTKEDTKAAAAETTITTTTTSSTTAGNATTEEEDLKSSLKSQLVDVFGGKAEKMVQSMERIVNQLQTLKGLESSLRVLQVMGGEGKEDSSASKTGSTEVDQTEAARKKVAALLATESDSEGEGEVCPFFFSILWHST